MLGGTILHHVFLGVKMIVSGIVAYLIGCNRIRLHRRGNTLMEVLRDILTLGTYHRTARLKAVCMFECSSDTKCLSANLFICASWKRVPEPLGWASSVLYSSFIQKSITVSQLEGCHDPLLWGCALEEGKAWWRNYRILYYYRPAIWKPFCSHWNRFNLSCGRVELRWSSHGKSWLVTTLILTFSVLFMLVSLQMWEFDIRLLLCIFYFFLTWNSNLIKCSWSRLFRSVILIHKLVVWLLLICVALIFLLVAVPIQKVTNMFWKDL